MIREWFQKRRAQAKTRRAARRARQWKRGYIAARNFARQHTGEPFFACYGNDTYDTFDEGWDAGLRAELKHTKLWK